MGLTPTLSPPTENFYQNMVALARTLPHLPNQPKATAIVFIEIYIPLPVISMSVIKKPSVLSLQNEISDHAKKPAHDPFTS
jgi:hypothetical protein